MQKNLKKFAAYVLMLALILAWAFDFIPFLHLGNTQEVQATTETFATGGSSTWQAPAGVFSVVVECWGGGGAGGGDNTKNNASDGYGGGGGAYASKTISVTPGNTYSYTVGAGGTGGTGNGGDGGDSVFTGDGSVQCVADNGYGGTSSAVGAGGNTTNSDGTTEFTGGAGHAPSGTTGGGGGGSAGTGSNGNSASGTSGATAVTGGGPGGNGGASNNNGSTPASNPGGGGGGAGSKTGAARSGGDGAPGQIKLTYTAATAPGSPTSLTATAGAAQIDLSWATPASDGGSAITGYKIYRDTASPATTLIDTIGVTTTYNDTTASPGTLYYYRVTAVNAVGESSFSNEDSATANASINLSGHVYQSEGGSAVGSGKTVSVYKNGSTSLGSAVTDASGAWSLTGSNISSGDIITAYIDNDATYHGNTVFLSDGTNKTDVDIYAGSLIVRHDTGSNITNANLSTGHVSSDPTDMEYSVSGSDITTTSLYIWTGDTYAPGGNITLSGNFKNNGTFTAGSGTVNFTNNLITSTISSASDITFNNISSTAYGKHLQFQKQISNSPKFTVSGTFSVSGISGTPIYISSDTAGSQWIVFFNSAQTLTNIHLADSGCSSGSATVAADKTIGDGGNNGTCWGIINKDAPGPAGEPENIGGGSGTLHTGGVNDNVRDATGINPHGGGNTVSGGGQGGGSTGAASP